MIDSTHTTCDICGAVRGETNHWQVAIQAEDMSGIMFVPAEEATVQRNMPRVTIQDICGQACAVKRLSQYFTS